MRKLLIAIATVFLMTASTVDARPLWSNEILTEGKILHSAGFEDGYSFIVVHKRKGVKSVYYCLIGGNKRNGRFRHELRCVEPVYFKKNDLVGIN